MSLAQPSRRQVVAAAAGVGGLVALAACGGGGSSGSSSSGASSAPAGGATSGTVLTPLSAVPVGSAVSAKDGAGKPLVVAQPTAGKAVAFSAVCTHMGCTVAPQGTRYQCPCHGSAYDAATGHVINGPATRPLAPVAVRVEGGNVVTA